MPYPQTFYPRNLGAGGYGVGGPSLYGRATGRPFPELEYGRFGANPPGVSVAGAPNRMPQDPTDNNAPEISAEEARLRAANAGSSAANAATNAAAAASRAASTTQLHDQQQPFFAAETVRKNAQAAAGIPRDASPSMAAGQLGNAATAGITDPVDAQMAKERMGLTPLISPGTNPEQTNLAVASALRTAQAGKAGAETTAVQGAYDAGRTPMPATFAPGATPPPPAPMNGAGNLQPTMPRLPTAGVPSQPPAPSPAPIQPPNPESAKVAYSTTANPGGPSYNVAAGRVPTIPASSPPSSPNAGRPNPLPSPFVSTQRGKKVKAGMATY